MKVQHVLFSALCAFALLLPLQAQIPRTLSYQAIITDAAGELKPDGSYTFTFRLYDASSGGTALWTESKTISVKDGLFFTALGDQVVFPASLRFDRPYWLSIQVASEAELSPRVPLTSVGYSFATLRADSAQHAVRADTAQVVTGAVTATNLADDAVTSAKILDGTIQSGDVAASFTAPYADTSHYADTSDYALAAPPGGSAGGDLSGTYPDPTIATGAVTSEKILDGTIQRADVAASFTAPYADTSHYADTSDYALAAPPGGGTGWSLAGNSITTSDFLGSTNNIALDFRVNNTRALRLEPNAESPNVIGGYSDNSVTGGVLGATISGGGISGSVNQVTGIFGTIGGGINNTAAAYTATVGGGQDNTAAYAATIGGGQANSASGNWTTVGGGENNSASGKNSAVSGGGFNNARGLYSVVSGGGGHTEADSNSALGDYSAVGGGNRNTASDVFATVGGGAGNTASYYATVGGGYSNNASGNTATVGGGVSNNASGSQSTIGGGYHNNASGSYASVGGGYNNTVSGNSATVPGGNLNVAAGGYSFAAGQRAKANHAGAFVWADGTNADFASIAPDEFAVRATGGFRFLTSTDGSGLRLEPHATSPNVVGGHSSNTVTSGKYGATIGGGGNSLSVNQVTANYGTVGGGYSNTASGGWGTVGGGIGNTASGVEATVGGGYNNNASGQDATVPGGNSNVAGGDFSFAAGYRAKANHSATFVWADRTLADFASTAANQFLVRAQGGTIFYSNGGLTAGVVLTAGGGSWSSVSDRNLKENFRAEDGEEVLAAIAAMPIPNWNYKSQDPSIRHLGPMAQDFYAAFGLGEDEKRINTVDIDGINLLAIQELEKRTRDLEQVKEALVALQAENAAMKVQMARFESALQRLEAVTMAGEIAESGETTVAEVQE